jgi:REP element-mobilizing transposase RayT
LIRLETQSYIAIGVLRRHGRGKTHSIFFKISSGEEEAMAYLRVWIQLVWSTKNREPFLNGTELRQKLFQHIAENATSKNIHLDCVNGAYDHVHALVSLGPDQTIAKIAQLLKGESSHWLNQQDLVQGKFEWQVDYFASSVSDSAVERVRTYIKNQEEHHRKKSFSEEWDEFIKNHGFSEISLVGLKG